LRRRGCAAASGTPEESAAEAKRHADEAANSAADSKKQADAALAGLQAATQAEPGWIYGMVIGILAPTPTAKRRGSGSGAKPPAS